MGSAIECFDNAGAVVVPRERFAPVKTTNDLFILRSDVYKVHQAAAGLTGDITAGSSIAQWHERVAVQASQRCMQTPCSLFQQRQAAGNRGDTGALVQVSEASTVVLTVPAAPSVKLDDKYYKLVDKLEALCEAPPSLREAKSLTVKGPVLFRRGCVFQGDTLVVNGALVWKLHL